MLLNFSYCWIVFIHVVWVCPGGLLQLSKGEAVINTNSKILRTIEWTKSLQMPGKESCKRWVLSLSLKVDVVAVVMDDVLLWVGYSGAGLRPQGFRLCTGQDSTGWDGKCKDGVDTTATEAQETVSGQRQISVCRYWLVVCWHMWKSTVSMQVYCDQKKNTHLQFLSYLHEWCVDLNKNCSEYT